MTRTNIKMNTIGRIIKGENPNWFIKIEHDKDLTGGFYIYQFKNKCGKNLMGEAFDNWVETFEDVEIFFDDEDEDEWEIEWESPNCK